MIFVIPQNFLKKLFIDLPFLNIECVKHGEFLSDESRDDLLLKFFCDKYNIKPEESVLIDRGLYNLPSAIKLGMNVIRMRSEFTTDTPAKMGNIPEVKTLSEILEIIK